VVDIVDSKTRSRMMSGIRGKNTKPEVLVRKALTLKGYRYRLHRKDLPGRLDIVIPGQRIAIFVHGCFWHQHEGCRLAKMPSTRQEFWAAKLGANIARDRNVISLLVDRGWRVLQVWECATKSLEQLQTLPDALAGWIKGAEPLGMSALSG
jgi:DNA mismatch endonuclease (patch repair protein)